MGGRSDCHRNEMGQLYFWNCAKDSIIVLLQKYCVFVVTVACCTAST